MSAPQIASRYLGFVKEVRHRKVDVVSPVAFIGLALIGVACIHSAQAYSGGGLWKMQLIWLALGLGVYGVVATIDYKIFLGVAHWLYGASLIGLLLVLTPLGVEIYGARRWLDLGVTTVQPSEAVKVALMIMLASVLTRSRLGTFRESLAVLLKVAVIAGVPAVIIFLQPDLGTTLVIPPLVFSLLYVSKLSHRFFAVAAVVFLLAVGVIGFDAYRFYQHTYRDAPAAGEVERERYQDISIIPLRDYQRVRILSFVVPEVVDPRGTGDSWNVTQSKISIGSGGFLGKGFGHGTQALLGYLPSAVAHNDFIFAVLAEEHGFIGSGLALILFTIIIMNGFRIAALARDRLGMLIATGVSVLLLVHVFINVGMNMGLMPVTGLPLPFMSYGGSFLLSCCVLQGLVQSVYRFRKEK